MQQRRRPSGSNDTWSDDGASAAGAPAPPSLGTSTLRTLQSLRATLAAVRSVLNLPTFIIIVIAALDSADKGLLASSFPMLEKQLGMSVETLGYFSLFTNLSYSFALPLWGWCVHRYSIQRSPSILAGSCALWGTSTLGIALAGSSVGAQALFRSINGGAVASILPLSQMLLVEFVPGNMLGRAFGLMGFAEKLAGTVASASIIWFSNWQMPYFAVGVLSLVAAAFAQRFLAVSGHGDGKGKRDEDGNKKQMTLGQIVRRITRIPAFLCLVGQGIFGGIPWDMMSFLLLLFEWRGLSREQVVSIQFTQGISGTIGTPLGGVLGDRFAHLPRGRIYVALTSVVLGTISFGIFLFSTTYKSIFFWFNLFHLVAGWTTAAANRPICAEMAQNPSERAQIVSLWLLLEKTAAAIFGAPLVGYLTSGMIDETTEKVVASPEKANALAYNIFVLSTLFWILCCCFWCLMAYFVDSNAASGVRSGKGGVEYAELGQREDAVGTGNSNETIASSEAMGRGIELLQVA